MRCPKYALAAGLVLAVVASGCTSSGSKKSASSAPAAAPGTTSTSSHAKHKATKKHVTKKKVAAVNPLTGIGPVPKLPLIAVKIDDTAPGRPQRGIRKADIVYIEEVEGGLTRLVAVFGTRKPVVGYVRSTRPSDPDLLLQYGRITEAASGGGGDALPRLDASGLRPWINDRGAGFYSRIYRPESSYINLTLDLSKVAKSVHTSRPRDIGLRWSRTITTPSNAAGKVVDTMVGGTPVEFRYAKALHRYIRYIDGVPQRAADGKYVSTPNVIVQRCLVRSHPQDRDVLGNPSQFTYTTGRGPVSVFRDGRRIDGVWLRGNLHKGTRFATRKGKLIRLKPGGTWVVLARLKASVRSS